MQKFNIESVEDNIRALMRSKQLTAYEFAKTIKMNGSALRAILEGVSKPSLKTLIKIANRHGVTMDSLCEDPADKGRSAQFSDKGERKFSFQ
jgi:transcriptional regulator with XRE-family HTH domain